jgi:hypothetical protein
VKVHEPIETEHPLQKTLLAPGAARCTAKGKHTKKPCQNPAIAGGFVCRMHGGSAPQVKLAAKERLMALQPLAIQTLNNLLKREEFPTVQLGAAKDVLDRTDGKAFEQPQELNITINIVDVLKQRHARRLTA